MRLVRRERTGWRDLAWNLRQRCHGYEVPFCDVDCLQYDNKSPVAAFEDVNQKGKLKLPAKDPGIASIKRFADGDVGRIPFFGRRIASDFKWFIVRPLNMIAHMWPPPGGFGNQHSEAEHVVWKWRLGGRSISVGEAAAIIEDGIKAGLDKPEIRSALFLDLDDVEQLDRDIAKLDAIDLIKILSAINRRLK